MDAKFELAPTFGLYSRLDFGYVMSKSPSWDDFQSNNFVLVSEPYFNEAGYERQKGTQQGCENSRMYNEMVVLKLVQAMTRLALNPPEAFKDYVLQHFQSNAKRYF